MGLFGAFIAAIAYGIATIAQAIGVQRASAVDGGVVRKALAGWAFGLGLMFDGVGCIASFAALRELPLFLVESATASSVAVTAVLALPLGRSSVGLAFVAGLGFAVVGLASRLLEIPARHVWKVVEDPMAWGLVAGGMVAVVGYAMALDRGSTTAIAAVTFSTETIIALGDWPCFPG